MSSAASAVGSLRSGHLEARLAASPAEIEAAQLLRWRVFYQEMGAQPTPEMTAAGRDIDEFDAICDHLLVLDTSAGPGAEQVVGTYRLTRRAQAEAFGRYYTAGEYDIAKIVATPGNILELGRSCVDAAYRNTLTMQLLWRAIAHYINVHRIEVMFGCASLPGTDPQALAVPLSYLAHFHLAPSELRPVALPERYTEMRLLPPEQIDQKRALAALPPLIKGYLRLGGFFGDGAVIDHQFNTTDVCVIVKSDLLSDKYSRHYERTAKPQE
jgi:putative hemolysin